MTRGMIGHAVRLYQNTPFPEGQAVGIVVGVLLDHLRPAPLPGPRWLGRTAGLVSLAAGSAVNVWALRERRRRTTAEFQLEHPESLVTTGPYALTRHPMYVGSWLIHLGVGLMRGSAWAAATLPAAALVEHLGVLAEERALDREFGDAWARYRDRVPRYLAVRARSTAGARPTS